jgi:CheY-like chemotaxis protein
MIGNHFSILLIDDNKHGLIARRAALEEGGYLVETAACGTEGLAKVEEREFDLIVTDYRMPDLTGCEVVKRVRERHPQIPVVILSGFAGRLGLTEDGTGADAVLVKGPSEHLDLLRTIGRLVRKQPTGKTGAKAGRRSSKKRSA